MSFPACMSFPRVLGGIHNKFDWIPTFVGKTRKSGKDKKEWERQERVGKTRKSGKDNKEWERQ